MLKELGANERLLKSMKLLSAKCSPPFSLYQNFHFLIQLLLKQVCVKVPLKLLYFHFIFNAIFYITCENLVTAVTKVECYRIDVFCCKSGKAGPSSWSNECRLGSETPWYRGTRWGRFIFRGFHSACQHFTRKLSKLQSRR